MKMMILAALAAISLGVGAANAASPNNAPGHQQTGNQYNWLGGGD